MKVVIPKRVWQYPMAVERGYKQWIMKYIKSLTQSIKDNLVPIQSFINSHYRQDDDTSYDEQLAIAISSAIQASMTQEQIETALMNLYTETDIYNKGQIEAVYKSLGQAPIVYSGDAENTLRSQFTQQNRMLVESIRTDIRTKLIYEVNNQVNNGYDEAEIIAVVNKAKEQAYKRADKIAHNEIGNLDGRMCKQRQLANGITHYQWRTVRDERVRPWHEDREGKIFAWNKPPFDGHPREALFCRCEPAPCIPWNNLIGISRQKNIPGAEVRDI